MWNGFIVVCERPGDVARADETKRGVMIAVVAILWMYQHGSRKCEGQHPFILQKELCEEDLCPRFEINGFFEYEEIPFQERTVNFASL